MTLKIKNIPYLTGFVLLLYIAFAFMNGLDWSFAQSMEIGKEGLKLENPVLTLVFHFLVLILTSILPSKQKHRLIYMRWYHPLPGSRVFSNLLDKDERISRHELVDEFGELPTTSENQNALWYKIYKTKQTDAVVLSSHGYWLLFRDLFAISFVLLLPSTIFTFWNSGVKVGLVYSIFYLFILGVLWFCARVMGERFACNVIAR
jgi:hypothetical protein